MLKHSLRFCLVLSLSFLAGCSPGACLAAVTQILLQVEDANGAPVTDAVVTVQLVRTGETLEVAQSNELMSEGKYVVANHSLRRKVRSSGDTLEVTVSKNGESVQLEIKVEGDRGRCGVYKVSGPDKITF